MRVLFTSWGWSTHFQPAVPLAWALRVAGHEVAVASQPGLADVVAGAGLTMLPVGHEVDIATLRADPTLGRVHDTLRDPAVCYQQHGEVPEAERSKWLAMQTHFTLVAEAMVDDLVALTEQWRPDLLVWEQTTFAGAVAARVHDVPDIRLVISPDVLGDQPPEIERQLASPDLAALFERFGLAADRHRAHWTVDQCPPSLRLPTRSSRVPMRYTPYAGGGTRPDWARSPGQFPRICLSAGLTTGGFAAQDTAQLPEIVDYLRELDVEVVIPGAADAFPELADDPPPNVRVLEYVPLSLVLPTCSAIVHHGGGGTMLTAAAWGVPQVVLPQIVDQAINAHQIARSGAGRQVPRERAGPDAVRTALAEMLSEAAFAVTAGDLAAEIAHQPNPAAIVQHLERGEL
ncbi:UDP:flavonoid glycosyltransferase YjiC (YdhE family) [Actinopolyspora biskrensis]|uniref:UDP:flavonoid glycosyltransferase YjiC (YdhE family) n=1 Tax=Actinopolyspora biskrensis TaxID=1470178 RepID=A0A852YTK6_9ACTN|nr:nucleotide disphospho-sugar-binding domain-containing protein [Actinopolyspora biskrensis]NYH77278.1 UDP:flavonoid glycosyltransferase YjiC (YdhE family) [Actinopolyspora biskrensis]